MITRYIGFRPPYISKSERDEYEPVVQNGLAVTPAQMMDLAKQGIPVSTSTLGAEYYDGKPQLDFDVNMEFQRGIDIGDMYQARQDSKAKVRRLKQQMDQQMQSNPQNQ